MKLNNKGFTLVEVLAVVIILSILAAIMIPSVNNLIEKNKENTYKDLKKNIISAAKVYVSDNRYNITLDYGDELCETGVSEENIASISTNNLNESKLPIELLVASKDLSTNKDRNIINPKTDEILDLNKSYVLVKYKCSSKDYTYTLEESFLTWK